MTDDRLQLLRREGVNGLKNIDPESVEFRIVLESRVRGDLNPVASWNTRVPHVLTRAGFPA